MLDIRVSTAMREAVWDEPASLWRVTTTNGVTIQARVLASAVGGLHIPKYPEIKGLEKFAGPKFHSTEWDSSVQLGGKHIAVIGTGASSIQFVPEITPPAGRLYLFHRTPPWIVPKSNFAIPYRCKNRSRRLPLLA